MNILKKSLIATALLASATTAQTAFAESPVSGSVALTSNYIFRGLQQNDEDPALQGSLDYAHDSGFYAGVWGSNVSFGDGSGGNISTELDFYGGYGFEAGGIGFDFGLTLFTFFGSEDASDANVEELHASASYAGFDLIYYLGLSDAADTIQLSYSVDLAPGVSFTGVVGDFDEVSDFYWSAGISGEVYGVGWDITVADADTADDTQVAFTISKSL